MFSQTGWDAQKTYEFAKPDKLWRGASGVLVILILGFYCIEVVLNTVTHFSCLSFLARNLWKQINPGCGYYMNEEGEFCSVD